jgi:hypothetical protein
LAQDWRNTSCNRRKQRGKVLQAEEGLDLEQGGVPHDNDNGQESSSTPHQQKGKQHQGIVELQGPLLNLCWAIELKWITKEKDQDLTSQFNEIAANICSGQGMPHKTFITLVREARKKLWEEESIVENLKREASIIRMHFAP